MMKPSLQLRIGQQLTMTPQLQQAIRLLQLPTIELQAQVLQALETNVMLEPDEEFEATTSLEALQREANSEAPEGVDEGSDEVTEPAVEISDDWAEPNATESETPWSGSGEGELELPDESGRTLRDHLCGSSSSRGFRPPRSQVARAIVDAINDDGYLTEPLEANRRRPSPARRRPMPRAPCARSPSSSSSIPPASAHARIAECIELQLAQLDPATPGLATARTLAHRHLRTDGGPPARRPAARDARERRRARRRARAGAQLPPAPRRRVPGAAHGIRRARRLRSAHAPGLGGRAQTPPPCRASG
jgi:RNA polymerase sigma-54 factor